jgi:hypothetical protein
VPRLPPDYLTRQALDAMLGRESGGNARAPPRAALPPTRQPAFAGSNEQSGAIEPPTLPPGFDPQELVDWNLLRARRMQLGMGMSLVGTALLCLCAMHFSAQQQHHGDPTSAGAARPLHPLQSTSVGSNESLSIAYEVPNAAEAADRYDQNATMSTQDKDEGLRMLCTGLFFCLGAAPLIMGFKEFSKALAGSCCCCCIDMSSFLSHSETCSMLFIRILLLNWYPGHYPTAPLLLRVPVHRVLMLGRSLP